MATFIAIVRRAIALTVVVVVAAGAAAFGFASTERGATGRPRILFGVGPEADSARSGNLARAAPVGMLTTWFNGTADFSWISTWKNTEVRDDYASGHPLHLIVYSAGAPVEVRTRYGTACGLAYPLSAEFLKDITRLARIFRGPPGSRLYVTLFTEFQTYACDGNDWAAEGKTTTYFKALKRQYRGALKIFHRLAPGSAVSLGWGGWQAEWNAPRTGGGRSLFKRFADVMRESDFESFEVINSNSDVSDILAMTRELGRYGPVMLAYYRPNGETSDTATAHLKTVLSERFLARLIHAGLFGISFMDERFLTTNPASAQIVSEAIRRFGCRACGPPRTRASR